MVVIRNDTFVPVPLAGTEPEPIQPVGIRRVPGWSLAASQVASTTVAIG